MIVWNGTEDKRLTSGDLVMRSVSPDKIVLPYVGKPWGDLLYEILNMCFCKDHKAAEQTDGTYDSVVDSLSIGIGFNVQRKQVRPMAHVQAETRNGVFVDGRVFLRADDQEMYELVDSFFSAGGIGLSPEFLAYYLNMFRQWAASKKN